MSRKVVPDPKDGVDSRAIRALTDALDGIIRSPITSGVHVEHLAEGDGSQNIKHGLGRKAIGAILLGSDKGQFVPSMRSSNAEYCEVVLSPQWELMERYDVDAVISADIEFDSDIDGDSDDEYRVDGLWKGTTGAQDIMRWLVNGAGAGLTNAGSTFRYTNLSTGTDSNGLVIAQQLNAGSATEHAIDSVLMSESSDSRLCMTRTAQTWGTANTNQESGHSGGKWESAGTKITSLGLTFTNNNCQAGSYFNLYRRPRLDGRRLSLWVF